MEHLLAWHGICSTYLAPVIWKQAATKLEGSIYDACMKHVCVQLKNM